MKKICILIFLALIFSSCNTKKSGGTENQKSESTQEKISQTEAENDFDVTACFELAGINYNIPGDSIYSNGELFLIFKNYKTEFGTHIFKIIDSSMTITKIEQLADGIVAQGDLFKVSTFIPGGGTYYKFTFENGKLLKYAIDMPEGNESSPEYSLEQEYDFTGISKMKLEKISIIK